ncbi:MAG: tRNA (adenosine(37)-N6)-threonylcarbamoyltransferase complex dimerization subunit type 1 TsaB [Rhodobiaceae bacterium]|nr:MAG: tRNA (adenosine(37)-N6)-threonylcarbamoyltransferase complex dimerization subunit type 1 TsaB [Rhodobiaceae bacterium]
MTLLAMDTGQAACSVALWREGKIIAHRYTAMPKGHAEVLVPMIEEVQNEAGFAFEDLDALAVTVGPGTFTGLRVGLATARGIALASGKPLIGVTTLEAIAHAARGEAVDKEAVIAASFDARRDEIYLQCFATGEVALTEPSLVTLDTCNEYVPNSDLPIICVGTGAALLMERLAGAGHDALSAQAALLPDARCVAEIAAARGVTEDSLPGPLYLRAPDAKLPKAQP